MSLFNIDEKRVMRLSFIFLIQIQTWLIEFFFFFDKWFIIIITRQQYMG